MIRGGVSVKTVIHATSCGTCLPAYHHTCVFSNASQHHAVHRDNLAPASMRTMRLTLQAQRATLQCATLHVMQHRLAKGFVVRI